MTSHLLDISEASQRLGDVIVVEYADRLAQFGYSYLKEFAEAFNVGIETLEQGVKLNRMKKWSMI